MARASSNAVPRPSSREENTNKSANAVYSKTSGRCPKNETCSATPSARAVSSSAPRSGPAPKINRRAPLTSPAARAKARINVA
jgi:hypothetical protein